MTRNGSEKGKTTVGSISAFRTAEISPKSGCGFEKRADDLDGDAYDTKGLKCLTHGAPPERHHFKDESAHFKFLGDLLRREYERDENDSDRIPPEHICVAARTHAELDKVADSLGDLPFVRLGGDLPEPQQTGVNLATMHRVKGLEFEMVILVSMNEGLMPLSRALESRDAVDREQAEQEERCLLYVALTRTRKLVKILSYGKRSPLLPE